ncbi:hypothetical protein CKF54_01165 [Psittacicella hinzii]|uniref:HTH lysR-type domain-containing protein n=1 Tax=Psittacicella hinzii TaxID=2028575 RepID=A0A3A1YAL1_9GAMM|nr:LysR family transcriptional regulator [Psittacicella hinzii]RIY34228.1 hypothetical protein CKF54_01165 [Psittacicella hinzii]
MDRLKAMEIFLDVADLSSFSEAAERHNISTAKVSRYISFLEDWTGARLFNRTTRKVTLTYAGEMSIPKFQKILNHIEDITNYKESQQQDLSGEIRLTTSVSFGIAQLARILGEFTKIHPKVNIHLLSSDASLDLVSHRIDLAIRFTSQSLDSSLIARKLGSIRSVLVASPEYLAEQGEINSPEELEKYNFIQYSNFTDGVIELFQQDEDERNQKRSFKVRSNFTSNEATTICSAVLANQGVALLPRYLADKFIAEQRLVEILPEWQSQEFAAYVVYTSRRNMPIRIRKLIDFLAEECTKYQW